MVNHNKRPVALVTGSTSGIGKEAALLFGAHGFITVVTGRRQLYGEAVVEQINNAGGEAHFFHGNLVNPKQPENVVRFASSLGELAVLVNCAGSNKPGMTFDGHLETNYLAPRRVTEAAIPHMRKGACIVMVTSICSESRQAHEGGVYSEAKAAITSYMHGKFKPLAQKGIRAHIIAPGLTDTADTKHIPAASRAKHIANMPLTGDYLNPADVAQVIYDVTTWQQTTGQTITVDGGMTTITG